VRAVAELAHPKTRFHLFKIPFDISHAPAGDAPIKPAMSRQTTARTMSARLLTKAVWVFVVIGGRNGGNRYEHTPQGIG
jgi:hypothetical protein